MPKPRWNRFKSKKVGREELENLGTEFSAGGSAGRKSRGQAAAAGWQAEVVTTCPCVDGNHHVERGRLMCGRERSCAWSEFLE